MFADFDRYTAAFLTGLLVTYVLTPWIRQMARRLGVVDMPGERRAHKHPTARGGGLAVVLGFHAACLVALAFPASTRPGGLDWHWWLGFAPASLVLLVVGLIDDIRGMVAWQKLCGQVVAATLVCLSGANFGKIFGVDLPPVLDGALVVVWIVAVINAFNLIDGLDGLASGLAIISATGLCGILILGNLPGTIVVLLALIGACLAFLRYNFQPATIFLGDTGSMFIGLVLGTVSLQTFTKNTFLLSMTIPMLVLGVPIYDALLAIWRRSVRRLLSADLPHGSAKRPGIMQPDVDHLHHRLLKSGLSTRRVALTLFLTNGGLVTVGLLVTLFRSHEAGIFLLGLLAAAYVLLRHMAVIELRDTGRMLLSGLRRPTHALLKSLAFPVWDMFCLAGSLCVAMLAFESQQVDFWHTWFLDLPVWVTPTFSLLAMSRTYVIVWTRARVLDVIMLLFTLQSGLLMSLGIALLIDPANVNNLLIRVLFIGALAHSGIIGARLSYRCIEELVYYLRTQKNSADSVERIVLYGAGGRCQMFLKERGFSGSSSSDDKIIVGMIDDEPTLRLKWVYGYLVLGGAKDLSQLVPRHRVTGILITATLKPEALAAIQELATEHKLSLREWYFENRALA